MLNIIFTTTVTEGVQEKTLLFFPPNEKYYPLFIMYSRSKTVKKFMLLHKTFKIYVQ